MHFIYTFILLFGSWMLLSGKFDLFHLGLGALSSMLVAWTSNDLLFKNRDRTIGQRLAEKFRFVRYAFWLLYQILVANVHVIALALLRRYRDKHLDPNIFNFKTILKTDFARFVLANSITLTPGTVTIRIEDDVFYVHAISRMAVGDFLDPGGISEMERRVAEVFEPEILG